jgi:hypothetical protein
MLRALADQVRVNEAQGKMTSLKILAGTPEEENELADELMRRLRKSLPPVRA